MSKRRWPRIIVHMDMDAYFAQVEQRDHPEWRNTPVAITNGQLGSCVITASYEARARGGVGLIITGGISPNLAGRVAPFSSQLSSRKHLKDHNEEIHLFTDSNYVRQGITEWINKWKINNWRTASKKPVANRDLWIELDELANSMDIVWNWVKGHSGDPGNERADQLANLGVDSVS